MVAIQKRNQMESLARVVRITEVEKHPDPETTQIGIVRLDDGRQVCVRLETYKPGDLAVYFPLGAVVPDTEQFRFIWEGQPMPVRGDATGAPGSSFTPLRVPLEYRRVSIRNMRGQESQGLLQPVKDFETLHEMPLKPHWVETRNYEGAYWWQVHEGMDVAKELGVLSWDDAVRLEKIYAAREKGGWSYPEHRTVTIQDPSKYEIFPAQPEFEHIELTSISDEQAKKIFKDWLEAYEIFPAPTGADAIIWDGVPQGESNDDTGSGPSIG